MLPRRSENRITDAILTLIAIAATIFKDHRACQPKPNE
jgi:hypothetical protein